MQVISLSGKFVLIKQFPCTHPVLSTMFVNMKGRKISMFIHGVFQLEAYWFSPQGWDGIEWLYYQINLGAWLCSSNDFPVNFMYSSLIVIVYYHHHCYHEIPNWQRATSWLFAMPPRIWIYNICMKTQHPDHWTFSPSWLHNKIIWCLFKTTACASKCKDQWITIQISPDLGTSVM